MADADKMSDIAQVAQIFFDNTLKFYDKAPIIASTGYLLIASSLPLFLILRFCAKMKHLDNQKVRNLLQAQVSLYEVKLKERTQPTMTAASQTATPPQT
ncbi:hypothetical protein [Citrobacter portucalensis]|uniref:hypothetical protein n=1 Tax=Citrobacter portucalensis TaxID=1639133 RepID=UPI0011ED0AF9|nr:hypothetical protein [Citrobacter portucalensis]KAA0537960.1 hypothetical protein F0322_14180 [Citrobacter portucalensis]